MKAAEIRATNARCQGITGDPKVSRKEQDIGLRSLQISMLTEIAAQLAEANEHLARFNTEDNLGSIAVDIEKATRPQWVWLSNKGKSFVVDAREVTGVELMDGDLGTDNPKVSIGMKGQTWLKTADGTVKEVCNKLGIPTEEGK